MQKSVYEFISKANNDPIVERRTCAVSGKEFAIFQSDLDFYNKISPTFAGKKFVIPLPTLSPGERQRRRLAFRNERKLYRRKCDASGKEIISMYSPDKPFKVYEHQYRWSDKWDPMDYGRAFDPSKSFTQQFKELALEVPKYAIVSISNENCDYTSICGYCKNCYLISASEYCENCLYSHRIEKCTSCVDCGFSYDCQQCYGCMDCKNCYNCINVKSSSDCSYCIDCENLVGCENCYLCDNLVNAKYHILNKVYDKDEYFKIIGDPQKIEEFKKQHQPAFQKNLTGRANESVFGNFVNNSKNVVESFEADNGENIKYSQILSGAHNLMDCSNTYIDCEWSYEIMSSLHTKRNLFSGFVYGCHDCLLCLDCNDSANCFGCVGLRNKEFCIFNKQYTKTEYEKIVAQIIEHMTTTGERGQFLDPSLSAFGYNETVAQEYFPLTKQEAKKAGYARQDNSYNPTVPAHMKTLSGDDIPADISKVGDDILENIFICEISGRPFRIVKQELEFYRKHNLALPRRHPETRHEERIQSREQRNLYLRNCDKCKVEMLSVYPETHNGKVYCESCYNKEIYG